jgi:hypothetical protein
MVQLFPGDISEGVAVNADVGARLPAVWTAASTAGFRFSRHCCNSPGCGHRGGLFPGCAAVGGGPPLPWTFAGGFSTCCISRLPPKCWPGVQQCVELVCDTPHMVYLGQCKRFCNPFIAAAVKLMHSGFGRRFGSAGAPSGSASSRPPPALGRLVGPVAPRVRGTGLVRHDAELSADSRVP